MEVGITNLQTLDTLEMGISSHKDLQYHIQELGADTVNLFEYRSMYFDVSGMSDDETRVRVNFTRGGYLLRTHLYDIGGVEGLYRMLCHMDNISTADKRSEFTNEMKVRLSGNDLDVAERIVDCLIVEYVSTENFATWKGYIETGDKTTEVGMYERNYTFDGESVPCPVILSAVQLLMEGNDPELCKFKKTINQIR